MTIMTAMALIILVVASILDYKQRSMPSFFLTTAIFIILFTHFNFFFFGLLSFVFAWMLYDMNFFGGIADVKAVTLIGLMIINFNFLLAFMVLVIVNCFLFQAFWRFGLKRDERDAPLIIPLTVVFLALIMFGGVA